MTDELEQELIESGKRRRKPLDVGNAIYAVFLFVIIVAAGFVGSYCEWRINEAIYEEGRSE